MAGGNGNPEGVKGKGKETGGGGLLFGDPGKCFRKSTAALVSILLLVGSGDLFSSV